MRVESDLSSSGFPGTFFTNDPEAKDRPDSPAPFDFGVMDTEKGQKESIADDGPMDIRPFNLESSKYSAHSLSFGPSKSAPENPITVALPTTRGTSSAIIQTLNKGTEKALPKVIFNSRPNTANSRPNTANSRPNTANSRPNTARSLMRNPSLSTQATGMSINSSAQAEVFFARRDQVVSAAATTVSMNTTSSTFTASTTDPVMPHESFLSMGLRAKGKFVPQPDSYGRI